MVTSIDRRTGLNWVPGGLGAQLLQTAVGGYVESLLLQRAMIDETLYGVEAKLPNIGTINSPKP